MPVNQLETEKDTLVLAADFPNHPPETLFNYWVDSELMSQWWPPVAEIDPVIGGRFHLLWPDHNWALRGTITHLTPGEQLGFTWQWDHSTKEVQRLGVIVNFEPAGNGTRLTISHGPYNDSEAEQNEREGHIQGWDQFITSLQNLTS